MFVLPMALLGFWVSKATPIKAIKSSKPSVKEPFHEAIMKPAKVDLVIASTKKSAVVNRRISIDGVNYSGPIVASHTPTISFTSDSKDKQFGTINLLDGNISLSTWIVKQPSDFINKMKREDSDWSSFVNLTIVSISPKLSYIIFRNNTHGDHSSLAYILSTKSSKLSVIKTRSFSSENILWSPDEKHLAYIRGGSADGSLTDSVEGNEVYAGPLSLNIYDLENSKEFKVISSDSLNNSFRWLNENEVMYGYMPIPTTSGKTKSAYRPNLYSYSAATRKSHLITKDAYNPTPSQDGKYIAFFGSSNLKEPAQLMVNPLDKELGYPWRESPGGLSLCLENTVEHNRVSFKPYYGTYPQILWMPDQETFVSMNLIKDDSKDAEKADFVFRDAKNQSILSSYSIHYPKTIFSIGLISSSPDGNYLYFYEKDVRVNVGQEPTFTVKIKKLNVRSGEVSLQSELTGISSVCINSF